MYYAISFRKKKVINIIFFTNTICFFIVIAVLIVCILLYKKYRKSKLDNEVSKTSNVVKYTFLSLVLCIPVVIFMNVGSIDDLFTAFIMVALILWLPCVLTFFNIRNLIKNVHKAIFTDISTIVIGGIYYLSLMSFSSITDKDYKTAIYYHEYHELLNSEYSTIIEWIIIIGILSLILLCVRKPVKTPPLQSAILIAFDVLMLLFIGLIQIQMLRNFITYYLFYYLYYFNLILISARRIYFHIIEQVKFNNEHETVFRTKAGERLHKIMSTVSGMTKLSFFLMLPIIAICEILYIILGQGIDGFIKAFTMTADWTFSTQTPPPPLDYSGHYLCTVAVCGHKEIVKPIRYGIRHNQRIIVNRQLLVANAFEDLIAERFPVFHRKIRRFYDTYGYPISKHITTKARADIIYILMKPLEYMFLIYLYMFDVHPEKRIAIQYSDYKKD